MNILPSPLLLLGVGGAGAAMLRGIIRAYGPGIRALNTVVNARMSELFTIIRTKIDEAELSHRINAGVFLTGGGAYMKNVLPLASNIFGRQVLLGKIVPEVEGLENERTPAALATIVGTLLQTVPTEQPRRSLMDFFRIFLGGKKKK